MLIVFVGAAGRALIEPINLPAMLTASCPSDSSPSHVGVRTSVHASSSLVSTIEPASLSLPCNIVGDHPQHSQIQCNYLNGVGGFGDI